MTVRPYKFIVQAVVQEIEDDIVKGEKVSEPVIVFGVDGLEEWAKNFPEKLAATE